MPGFINPEMGIWKRLLTAVTGLARQVPVYSRDIPAGEILGLQVF
jgi:hypothetical protein